MKRADRANARFALSLGDAELESGMLKLRDLDSGTETTVERQRIAAHLGAAGK
jgi:histidyl-tRNA synthetase